MNEILIYSLKVNIALALFYLLYRFVFYRDTFWRLRRFYLLSSIVISVIYPFISLKGLFAKHEIIKTLVENWVYLPEIIITPDTASAFSLNIQDVLLLIYGIASVLLLTRFVMQFISVMRWKQKSILKYIHGVKVRVIQGDIAPFSFFNQIYINPNLYKEDELKQILTHEKAHMRQWHSIDVVLSEVLTMTFWINPFTWLLKREMRQNLEFLADEQVTDSGCNVKQYQYHLVHLTLNNSINITNQFNVLPLKKRIIMMNKKRTTKMGAVKYLLSVPLVLGLVLSSNAMNLSPSTEGEVAVAYGETKKPSQEIAQNTKKADNKTKELKFTPPVITLDKEKIYDNVDTQPQYPGGAGQLIKYLQDNIVYPAIALEKNIQGRVVIKFVVNKDGALSDVTVMKSVDPSLDAEAIRVVKSMPKWTPGEQKGEKVNVQYVLPVVFKMTNSSSVKIDKKPLIIIDGERQPAETSLNSIDPETIESVSVLKDDKATEAYGEDGKNGVILITSKK